MTAILRNAQFAVKANFAHHAMVAHRSACDASVMRIRLKEFREKLALSQEEMAGKLGVSVSQISRWESGSNNIPSVKLPDLARAYHCRVGDIFDDSDEDFLQPGPTLYVQGAVQAGHFIEAWQVPEDEWERYTGRADISAPLQRRFGLRVVGESMNEVYPSGTILDCVAYDGLEPIPNGKRVIVQRQRWHDGTETTVKEYFRDAEGIEWLVPRSSNPAFQSPFRCDQPGDDIEEIRIIAIVVASIRPE